MTEVSISNQIETKVQSPESLKLSQSVIDLVYKDCQSGWNSDYNPEDDDSNFREVPKFPERPQQTSPKESSINRLSRRLSNTLKVIRNPESPELTKPDLDNRGWRIIVQREPDGSAVIFYSGNIPGTNTDFGKHQEGLKIFYAHKDGLKVAYIDDIETPNDNSWLAGSIKKSGKNWRGILKPYDELPYGEQVTIKKALNDKPTRHDIFSQVRADFIRRGLTKGGNWFSGVNKKFNR